MKLNEFMNLKKKKCCDKNINVELVVIIVKSTNFTSF